MIRRGDLCDHSEVDLERSQPDVSVAGYVERLSDTA